MTRRRWAAAGGLLVLALSAGAFALLRDPGGNTARLRPLRARAELSDRIVVFGDTVRAQVDITFDRRQIDPTAIKVRAAFVPWRRVGPAQVTRADAGSSSLLRIT